LDPATAEWAGIPIEGTAVEVLAERGRRARQTRSEGGAAAAEQEQEQEQEEEEEEEEGGFASGSEVSNQKGKKRARRSQT